MTNALSGYSSYLGLQEKSKRTIYGYSQDLGFFTKWLETTWNGPVYLEDITFSEIEAFLTFLKEERDYKPASRKRISAALKSFFKYAWKRDLCSQDIAADIEGVKYVPTEREYLTEEEALEFIDAIEHELVKIFALTLLYTGMRISEALALTIDDVDLINGWIHVRKGKGRKYRRIPISTKLEHTLVAYAKVRPNVKQFFATQKTGTLVAVTVQTVIRDTRNRLGIKKKVTPHTFRHSFASELVRNDANIVSISKLLGHADLKTTSIYTHVSPEQLVEAIEML